MVITLAQNSNIRRIDELGRIVIPKDIRKKLHMRDNEPLEIYIEDDEIRIKKYSYLPDINEFTNYLVDMGNRITNNEFIIADRERIISSSVSELTNLPLGSYLDTCLTSCKEEKNVKADFKIQDYKIEGYMNMTPIIIDNDRSGLIVEFNRSTEINNTDTMRVFKNLIEQRLNNY